MRPLFKILLTLFLIIMTGCLENKNIPTVNFELDKTAKILDYFESLGDFVNTDQAPGLISVIQLFSNQLEYKILDIRPVDEFINGHIQNSVHVSTDRLYEVVDSLYSLDQTKKISIISKNGQSSAYFVCLLRLAGFNNTFSVRYGMAYWNIDFAEDWLQSLKDENDIIYTNENYPKLPFTDLPNLNLPSSSITNREFAIYRIQQVIKSGFKPGINYEATYDAITNPINLKICYGKERLYIMPPLQEGKGHPVESIWYRDDPAFEFRSIKNLQTLPSNTPIVIYSADGQLSACLAAYLTVLGYNTKTLLFGANQLFYTRMISDPQLNPDTFKPEEINNYPYVTGN
jgi:rhodanese-related sulfurtransferase